MTIFEGMSQPVDGPQLEAGRRGLLGGPALIVDQPDETWVGGYTFCPETCEILDPVPFSCEIDDPATIPTRADAVDAFPYRVVGADSSSTFDRRRDHLAIARRHLAATRSHQIERELFDGAASQAATPDLDNLWLTKAGVAADETGGTPLAPFQALARLEQALASCLGGQRGLIHATPELVSLWAVGGTLRVDGQVLLTHLDTIVVAGSGYSGNAPGGAPADAGNSWAYGTGRVYVRLGREVEIGGDQRASQTRHTVDSTDVYVYQPASAIFSPCCVVAVEADLS